MHKKMIIFVFWEDYNVFFKSSVCVWLNYMIDNLRNKEISVFFLTWRNTKNKDGVRKTGNEIYISLKENT